MRTTSLNVKPIRFDGFGSHGSSMPGRGTDFYLGKLIAQNIVYAAYERAKSISDIAEDLGTSAAFIEDEVNSLEENGFMNKQAGGTYLSNVVISRNTNEKAEALHALYQQYAPIICEQYVPLVVDAVKDFRAKGIYTPKDDLNFLLWAAITCACRYMLVDPDIPYDDKTLAKYRVKRKDGGEYVAMAFINELDNTRLSFRPEVYSAPNNMERWGKEQPSFAWQLTTYYDSRNNDYEDNKYEDYCWLYEAMTGKLAKDAENAEKYKRLYDKGYLVQENGGDYVNMVVAKGDKAQWNALLPAMPDAFKAVSKEMGGKRYAIEIRGVPPHLHDFHRLATDNNSLCCQDFIAHVLAKLLADGVLKLPTEAQKKSLTTIMVCDALPIFS